MGIHDKVKILDGNLIDISSLLRIVIEIQPDEVYNLGAQSFVATSWQQPIITSQVTGIGVLNILEAVESERRKPGSTKLLVGDVWSGSRKTSSLKQHRSTQDRLMPWRNCLATGRP